MQSLCKHRQYQQDVFPCPICEGPSIPLFLFAIQRMVRRLWRSWLSLRGPLRILPSPPSLYECASVTYVMHTSLFYYVQILFLAHILANICSNLIFELPSLPCISHILGLLDLKYVLHITEDEFRIALPHRQMWHRSSVSLLSYSVHILLSTTEPCLRDCQRTCRLGRDSPLPPQQSVCALIYGASAIFPSAALTILWKSWRRS